MDSQNTEVSSGEAGLVDKNKFREVGETIRLLNNNTTNLSPEKQQTFIEGLPSNLTVLRQALTLDVPIPGNWVGHTYQQETLSIIRSTFRYDGIPALRQLGVKFIAENLDDIYAITQKQDDKTESDARGLIEKLAQLGDGESKKQAVELLVKDFEVMANAPDTQEKHGGIRYYTFLDTIIEYGDVNQHQQIKEFLINSFNSPDKHLQQEATGWFAWLLAYHNGPKQEQIVAELLDRFGLRYDELKKHWSNSLGMTTFQEGPLKENLQNIHELESAQPGITQYLMDEFGIYNLGRYPIYLLIRQYEQRNNSDLPYGIIIFPRDDNGSAAFYQIDKLLEKVFQSLDGKFALGLFECGSKYDLARAFLKLDHKFGQNRKISFAIIGGHGMVSQIQFGDPEKPRDMLHQQDLQGQGTKKTVEFFEPNPTVVLLSCETGKDRGIAQAISQLGARVIAPNRVTAVKDIQVRTVGDGDLDFTVKYTHAKTRTYLNGKVHQG